jgi:hypothetical protein
MVFAAREPGRELAGLPELVVEGLPGADARALLGTVIRGPLDARVRDRIIAETRGNPLALLELPRGASAAELAGGFGLPSALPLSSRIEESFRRRLEALPPDSQLLLLLAAADPIGEPVLVWRAAERLGIGPEAAAPAAAAGLLEFGALDVRFRHPLVRSAVYRSASLEDRQGVHRALAEAGRDITERRIANDELRALRHITAFSSGRRGTEGRHPTFNTDRRGLLAGPRRSADPTVPGRIVIVLGLELRSTSRCWAPSCRSTEPSSRTMV